MGKDCIIKQVKGDTMKDFSKQKKVDKSALIGDRIGFLRYCAERYESNGDSPISDKDYDQEYYECEALEPGNDFFNEVGGIAVDAIQGQDVPHQVTMGSLSKSLSVEQFEQWLRSQYPDLKDASFVLQHKVDGLSLGLLYKGGKLVQALTRGDGITGIDVTEKAKTVEGVQHTIPFKDEIEVRGECHKNRQDFYKKWHTSVGGEYKNPRNFTAGAMNEKDPEETRKKGLRFVAYEICRHDFDTEVEKNEFLDKLGFPTLIKSTKRTKTGIGYAEIAKAVQYYMDAIDRNMLHYDIDGIVVKLNDIKKAKKMGSVAGGRKPKSNRAVKFPPEQKETELIGVEVGVGRTGKLTPVGILKPVELGGAMMTRATLHNFGALVGKDAIKIGSIVLIAKKGDIIPQIVKVKKMGNKTIDIPTKCPACGEAIDWDDNKVELVCKNYNCSTQLNKKIDYWFKEIGVKGFGAGTISKLTDKEEMAWDKKQIVSNIAEMYYMLDNDRATEHPFRKYAYLKSQMGQKTYDNLLESIKSVTEVSLPIFIRALGIENIQTSAKDISDIAPSIDDIDKLTVDDLLKISGFGQAKANSFITSWKARRGEIKLLLKYVSIKKVAQASNKLAGKKFCFTGSFDSPDRNTMERMVGENGGKLASVSKELTALVFDGETMKGKYQKALELNVPIITQEDFLKLIEG